MSRSGPREPEERPEAIAAGMTLADISIRNHVFAWILMVALIGFGILCYTGFGTVFRGLGISQNPDVDFPIVSISISWEGASPEIMETDVIDVLEDACATVEGVQQMSSTARQGSANLTLEFAIGRDIDAALQDVQTKVSEAARHLPREIDPPTISKTNPEDQPIIRLALFGDRPPTFLADYVRNVIRPQLQMIDGIGEIHVMGFRDRNVRVWYDAMRLEAQGLTVIDVNQAVQREHQEVPAGRIEAAEREMNVRAQGEAIDVATFGELVVANVKGAPVHLNDVAVVEDGLEDRRRLNRAMGESSVGFAITKMRGSNAVQVGHDVKAKIQVLRAQLPEGLRLDVNWDTTTFIERSIQEILLTLVLAAILTGLVCWLFLGSWSTTVNVLLAIPTSILGTFIVIYFFGFTLNTYTVLGLTLVVGIVVDDAIMVLENIYRHREMGQGKVRAASVGAREITFAAAATTLAIVAIFLPVAFMKGIIGKFFFQFGVTISVAVLLSLLEALTLTPMRCSRFLEVEHRGPLGRAMDRLFRRLSEIYLRALHPALRHRGALLAGSTAVFLLSLGTIRFLRQEFIPSQDMSRFTMRFQTPVGTSLDATDRYFRQIESFLMRRPEVVLFAGSVGGGDVNTGQAYVNLKPPRERPVDPARGKRLSQLELMDVVRQYAATVPGGRVSLQDISQTGFSPSRGGGFPIEFNIRGRDWSLLADASRRIVEEMRSSGLVTDVDTDYQVGMPEVQIEPDRNRAGDLGVSMAAIGETVNAAIGGVRIGKFKDKGRRFDIRGRLLSDQRQRPEDIDRLLVRTSGGELVRLGQLIRIRQLPTLQTITRRDRERAISIYANVATGASQAEAVDRSLAIAHSVLPDGYRAVPAGSTKVFRESFQSLWFAFALGLVVAYMVLASQFNSFWHPVSVLLALPFSVTGALLALWIGGQSLNVYSLLGLILLVGIAKKNSIMLVDFTNQVRARGTSCREALLEACPIRLRPILMTSIATIAGALPPALAIGAGAELQRPMALALVGGMALSTLLTLFVVPAAYSALDDALVWNRLRRESGTGLLTALRRPRHAEEKTAGPV
ncbi:MAG TPA: efflux RND transporter permease subunit [Thermoanaerobaculia bacterium]|nr:efflux RND transporter permease subunit [Thermoanaerobaculia bacterium]HQR66467.1 efflux RND transporter permease subunit [Thermoanaerobaculia bacterium]